MGQSSLVEVAAKLQLKPGQSVFVADRPADVSLDLGDATMAEQPDDAEAMLWLCVDRESVGRD